MLFAIAVVCLLLGTLQLTKSDEGDPLEKAAQSAKAAASSSASQEAGEESSSAAPSSTPSDVADMPQVCVLNIGNISGLAAEVADELKAKGYQVGDVGNLQTQSVDENTIFFTGDQRAAAEKLQKDIPGGASLAERPDAFTRCPGDLALTVMSR